MDEEKIGMGELLKRIGDPKDLRDLGEDDLAELCREIREHLIETVLGTGGHLSTNLGSVELTVALHYVFDFLVDRILFDVGHQAYTHKILTGRADRLATQRNDGGISGFTNPLESEYDHFMGGHAGTAISTGLGSAVGSALAKETRKTVVVIGDASIGAGMAFEALNMAGVARRDILIVLNDNRMSISRTVGSLTGYLTKIRTTPLYAELKQDLKLALASLPLLGDKVRKSVDHVMETMKYYVVPGHLFEALGIKYFGPWDGHDVKALVKVLRDVRRHRGPALLHVLTEKGKGYEEAEKDPILFHGVSPRVSTPEKVPDPANGVRQAKRPSWTRAFSDSLIRLAEDDPRIIAITAAMAGGTGTDRFEQRFPERFFDVGICEQHGVGMAAGLAREGHLPVVTIYSTFLQRAYDQVFHDVVLNGRPVIFAMDRAGVVGGDGWSHHGLYDIAYLRTLPRVVLMAPKDAPELEAMLRFAAESGIIAAIRYPRGSAPDHLDPRGVTEPIRLGRGEILREGEDGALLAYGAMVEGALAAADLLAAEGVRVTVANARFAKPVDRELTARLATTHPFLLTLEDASLPGGFGSAVLEALEEEEVTGTRIQRLGIPAELVDHSSRETSHRRFSLTPAGVAERVTRLLHEKASHTGWR